MAFKLAGVSSASTGSGGVGTGVGGGGLSYEDFLNEWNWCWIAQDVEAAAELGRTLLERNRELESTVRKQQALIDDQTQEIEYLSKQNRLLRQAAESRLRLCEQLEASAAEADRVRADLHHQIDSQRHRHTTLKAHLEAAEERGDELQRLLDASRASEAQAKCQLRSFQQEQHRQSVLAADAETITTTTTTTTSECSSSSSKRSEPTRKEEELATVCRLVNDLAEVEERFHVMQSDWMEEKRKRMQLEAQLCQLENEHQSSIDYNNGSCSSGSGGVSRRESTISNSATHYLSSNSTSVMGHHHHLKTDRSLSLSEELISADFASGQWRDAWDDSHTPLSLIGSVRHHHHHHHHHHHNPLKDEEESGSDSSSSGFSDENRLSSSASKATQTDDTKCPSAAPTTTIDAAAADYKTLFRQIFDVIQQNK